MKIEGILMKPIEGQLGNEIENKEDKLQLENPLRQLNGPKTIEAKS